MYPGQGRLLHLSPFALGNVVGPILIGHLFDTVGRKKMISLTYALSAASCWRSPGGCFTPGVLSAVTQTVCWTAIFVVASWAASSAYLTVSEISRLRCAQWLSICSMPSRHLLAG